MSLTYEQAVDEILTVFKEAWDTTGYAAFYDDLEENVPSGNEPWARATLRHTTGIQATLANVAGVRRWRREGFLFIQIFSPVGRGLAFVYPLAKIVADSFEGNETPNGVWFRDVSPPNEEGPKKDTSWYQTNISIAFEYDEVK